MSQDKKISELDPLYQLSGNEYVPIILNGENYKTSLNSVINLVGLAPAGPVGPRGATGKSAYQSAVDNGFVGTETQWIASMGSGSNQAGVVIISHSFVASENLSEGMIINVWNSAGVPKARRCDATAEGKHAHGFIVQSYEMGELATVYFAGVNDKCSGLVIGDQYLSVTPGITSPFTPNVAGQVLQTIGLAISSTTLFFNPSDAAILA